MNAGGILAGAEQNFSNIFFILITYIKIIKIIFNYYFDNLSSEATIAIFGLLITVTIFYISTNHTKKLQQTTVCMEMFKIWISQEMYEIRWSTDQCIRKNNGLNIGDNLNIFGFSREIIENDSHKISNNIGIIRHFMADLNSLLEENLIDHQLTRKLFWDTALFDWYQHFEAAYEKIDGDGKLYFKNSPVDKVFYENHIKDLKKNILGNTT